MKYLDSFKKAKILIDESNELINDLLKQKNRISFDKFRGNKEKLYHILLEIYEDEINDPNFELNLFVVDILTSIKLIIFMFNFIERDYCD